MAESIQNFPDLAPPAPEQRISVYAVSIIACLVGSQAIFPDIIPDTSIMRVAFSVEVGGLSGVAIGWLINWVLNRVQGKVKPARRW